MSAVVELGLAPAETDQRDGRGGRGIERAGKVVAIAAASGYRRGGRIYHRRHFGSDARECHAGISRFRACWSRWFSGQSRYGASTRTGCSAVMTTKRPEIIVEGSDDGVSWKPYRFRWKPCELDRRPRFTTPHLPRLDWQMWFAALGDDCRSETWFLRFEQRLLEGSPEVLGLLAREPVSRSSAALCRGHASIYTHLRGWARRTGGLVKIWGFTAHP